MQGSGPASILSKCALVVALVCVTGCDEDVTQKCNELGLPKCDGNVAVNCEALCTMLSCDVEDKRSTCGSGSVCEVRKIEKSVRNNWERVEALCVVQPESSCEGTIDPCPTEDTYQSCHWDANVLVRTQCPAGTACRATNTYQCE